MTKIKLFNVRGEEAPLAKAWGQANQVEVELSTEALTMDTVHTLVGFDGVANSQIGQLDKEVYAALKELGIKQIAQRSAGFDMYNVELAKANDICITNVPSYSPESIAEFTATIALMLIRRVELIRNHVQDHNFTWSLDIRGRVLGDMTVAILGTGRIGQALARIFKGFGCKVIGYDLYPSTAMDGIIEYKHSIEEAVKEADVISLHMPATAESHHLFDEKMFANCKKGAILLNMARGAVVDTKALLNALDEGILDGAGIDTYEFEAPYVPKNWEGKNIEDSLFEQLITHPKVIYTPHCAYYTDEAVKNLVEGALNATMEVIETGDSKFRVNH